MKKILSFILFLSIAATAFAQKVTVSGTVREVDGTPAIGVSVVEKGTVNGVSTDIDGNYVISVESNAVLQFSSIGYVSQEINVDGRTQINVVLEVDNNMIEETVVVGYGVQKKSVVSAAISSISSEKLRSQSQTRIDNALQGMTSGVTVTQSSVPLMQALRSASVVSVRSTTRILSTLWTDLPFPAASTTSTPTTSSV